MHTFTYFFTLQVLVTINIHTILKINQAINIKEILHFSLQKGKKLSNHYLKQATILWYQRQVFIQTLLEKVQQRGRHYLFKWAISYEACFILVFPPIKPIFDYLKHLPLLLVLFCKTDFSWWDIISFNLYMNPMR